MPTFHAKPFALWLALLITPCAVLAANAPPPGELRPQDIAVLASTCANCHGPDGRSPGAIPSLRGLPAGHLLQRMQAFKAGQAADATVMTRLMKGYDEVQIRALSRWFATQEAQR